MKPLELSTVQTIGLFIFSTSLVSLVIEFYKLIYKRVKEGASPAINECDKIDPNEWWKRITIVTSLAVLTGLAGAIMYIFIQHPIVRKFGLGFLFVGIIALLYTISSIFEVALFEGNIGQNAPIGVGSARVAILGLAVIAGALLILFPSKEPSLHLVSV